MNSNNSEKQTNDNKKRRLLFIIVLGFMIVIVTIWGYNLKNKIDDVKQKSQESSGLLQNTKILWNEVFESDSSTPAIITTSTWNKIVSSTLILSATTTSDTTASTTISSSTVNVIKDKIEEKYKQ